MSGARSREPLVVDVRVGHDEIDLRAWVQHYLAALLDLEGVSPRPTTAFPEDAA